MRFNGVIFVLQDYWTQPTASWLGKNILSITLAPCPHHPLLFPIVCIKKGRWGRGDEIDYGRVAVYSYLLYLNYSLSALFKTSSGITCASTQTQSESTKFLHIPFKPVPKV